MGKVFIPIKSHDAHIAMEICSRLKSNSLEAHLEVIDDEVSDGPGLGEYIRQNLSDCDQLIAVVSRKTKEPWWVPWIIGIATEKDLIIATYVTGFTVLPSHLSYLKKWPLLQTMRDIDACANAVRETQKSILPGTFSRTMATREFYKQLKASLGQ